MAAGALFRDGCEAWPHLSAETRRTPRASGQPMTRPRQAGPGRARPGSPRRPISVGLVSSGSTSGMVLRPDRVFLFGGVQRGSGEGYPQSSRPPWPRVAIHEPSGACHESEIRVPELSVAGGLGGFAPPGRAGDQADSGNDERRCSVSSRVPTHNNHGQILIGPAPGRSVRSECAHAS